MRGDTVTEDGQVYVVVFDGAHGNTDLDLFRPVDWLERKEKPIRLTGGRSVVDPPMTGRRAGAIARWRRR